MIKIKDFIDNNYKYILTNEGINGCNIIVHQLDFAKKESTKRLCLCNSGLTGDFSFSIWDFKVFKEKNNVDFVISKYNLLYSSFKSLLGEDLELVIFDDLCLDDSKYFKIEKQENIILLSIVNNRKKFEVDKFNITIVNTLFDGRSKIDRKELDTKEKIWMFFIQAKEVINVYPQLQLKL